MRRNVTKAPRPRKGAPSPCGGAPRSGIPAKGAGGREHNPTPGRRHVGAVLGVIAAGAGIYGAIIAITVSPALGAGLMLVGFIAGEFME